MEFLFDFGLFASKTLFIFVLFASLIILIAVLSAKVQHKSELNIELLHKKLKSVRHHLEALTLSKEKLKEKKKIKDKDENLPQLFVLDFKGDIKASEVDQLREEITALLLVATPQDKVLIRLESPGGVVHGYGLGASQLLRLREKKIPLTVAVDKVAASGGYLMACTADKILCAPFGIVGSIGVVSQVPNFNRLLKKHEVDYKEYTAGEYKRTVSILGEITPKGEEKFKEQLEQTHTLFKHFVHQHRPQLKMDDVATGEYWYGTQALTLGLVDEVRTSDDYLLSHLDTHHLVHLKYEKKTPLREKLSGILGLGFKRGLMQSLEEVEQKRFP